MSVVAILYAIIANTRSSQQFERISSKTEDLVGAARDTKSAAEEVNSAAVSLKDDTNTILKRLNELFSLSKEQHKTTLNTLSKNMQSANNNVAGKAKTDKGTDASYFIDKSSRNTIMFFYACSLAMKDKREFRLSDFFKDGYDLYFKGVLTTACSAKLLDYDFNRYAKDNIFNIKFIDPGIDKLLPGAAKDMSGANEEITDVWNKINAFFEIEKK